MNREQQARQLFLEALEVPPEERASFLDEQCPDSETRRLVEELFTAQEAAGGFLEEPVELVDGSTDFPPLDGPALMVQEFIRFRRANPDAAPEAFYERYPEHQRAEVRRRVQEFREAAPPDWDTSSGQFPRRMGDFIILRELGHGSMGVVYLAWEVTLRRKVALKVLSPAAALSETQVARFREEAASAARLRHPGIVPVHHFDQSNGTRYIVMEYIEGETLGDWLAEARGCRTPASSFGASRRRYEPSDEGPLGDEAEADESPVETPRSYIDHAAELIALVADALQFAHDKNIIHRDLKPQNILIESDGNPRIADFGLARDLQWESDDLTSIAGTFAYMSPEQAQARQIPIDHRSDIFSLGVILYELLTLRRPFGGQSSREVLRQITQREPPPIRKRSPRVPRELAAIVRKALEKQRRDRYQSAAELAQDLRNFLEGRPVAAARWSRWWGPWRLVRDHWAGLSAAAAIIAVAVTASIVVPRLGKVPLTVTSDRPAKVYLRKPDLLTGKLGPAILIDSTPLRSHWVEPGDYRVVIVAQDDFQENARWIGRRMVVEAEIVDTDEAVEGMIRIPAGEFIGGVGGVSRQFPQQTYWLPEFYVDAHEVTIAEYMRFLDATGHPWPAHWKGVYPQRYESKPVAVKWSEARRYAEWAGKRLPTRLEWDRMARGRDGRAYPWGSEPGDVAARACVGRLPSEPVDGQGWFDSYLRLTLPPGSMPLDRSPDGVLDVVGNLREWTETRYTELVDGVVTEIANSYCVMGRSWRSNASKGHLRWVGHGPSDSPIAHHYIGFRCAKSVDPLAAHITKKEGE